MNEPNVRAWVEEYYGETLKGSADLKTSACCVGSAPPPYVAAALANVHPDVLERFYGCGWPIPAGVEGKVVLDLGCGTGRDVYLLAQLVGPGGRVIGLDMTESQLAVARATQAWHAERFGFDNVQFERGFIEDLSFLEDASIDVVVSNCVVNLSPRKDLVLAEVARVLRPGGELYLSDVVCDRRLPQAVAFDPALHAECLGGAMYDFDLMQLAKRSGFLDPREMTRQPITIGDAALQAKVGAARFSSVTLRLFKLADLEPRCEDYGQLAIMRRPVVPGEPLFYLDDHHTFELGRPERVCGNTGAMLRDTRFGAYFDVIGDTSTHFGEFPCGPTLAFRAPAGGGGACC